MYLKDWTQVTLNPSKCMGGRRWDAQSKYHSCALSESGPVDCVFLNCQAEGDSKQTHA